MPDGLSRLSEVDVSCLQGVPTGEMEGGWGDWKRLGVDGWYKEGVSARGNAQVYPEHGGLCRERSSLLDSGKEHRLISDTFGSLGPECRERAELLFPQIWGLVRF